MKSNRLKLLITVLIMFSFTFFMSIGSTKAIYREVKSTTINLTVISNNDCLIQFDSRGGNSVANRYVSPNTAIGTLPIPTKSGYNFAGWYDSNNQRVRHSTVITSDTNLHAVWTEIVCKLETSENNLHTETCVSGGCAVSGTGFNTSNNNLITYGTLGNGVPISGDAYNCDVDYNGIYDEKETDNKTFKERFYFVRTKTNTNSEDSAVMYYSTSFDSTGRNNRTHSKTDIESKVYSTAITYLPQATLWDNPNLIDLDGNGTVTRFLSDIDMEAVCGTLVTAQTSYFTTCQKWFWFENSRFQSSAIGRAGIWMEYNGGAKYHRIHTQSLNIGEVESSSENMARPVMEIPMSALEGYYDEDRFTISYNTYTGDPNPISNTLKYRGEVLGPLPIPTREHYTFVNWYTDSGYQNVADPTSLVSGNVSLYAKWEAIIPVEVTLHLNGGTINGVTSPINLYSGDYLNNLPDPTQTGYTFEGWYTDIDCTIPFDDTQPITADMDLYANWKAIPHETVNITLHLNGGTISGVTSPITINSGDYLNNLPDPTQSGYVFAGWYVNIELTIPFDDTVPITSDLDLYADWEVDTSVAEVNGVKYSTLADAINAVPNGTSTPTTVKILKDITLTSAQAIPSNKWVKLDLQSYTINTSSANLIENSGKLNIINGTMTGTYTANKPNAGYVILNKSSGTLNISGGTLIYNNTSAPEGKPVQNNGGTVTITGGRMESNAQAATINNTAGGTLNISGGEIIATGTIGKAQAIYMEGSSSVTNITGDVYIENAGANSNKRAAVDNYGGTLNIIGGTIVSLTYDAVSGRNDTSSITNIGINDDGGNVIDTTVPILRGKRYAINREGTATVNVYDGVYKSGSSTASNGTIIKPTGVDFIQNGTETISNDTYRVFYLQYTSGGPYTVTFDEDNGNTSTVSNISSLSTVGANMPNNPTKSNYIFEKWFVYKEFNNEVDYSGEFTSTTPVTDTITVMAKWKPGIGTATISPASISLAPTETETITVTGSDEMESYTFSSSDTTVATVDANGAVTAVAAGTATIYITGSESNESQTVTVTVSGTAPVVYHTVTFYKELNGEVVKTVQVEDGTQIGSANMPATNPTKTNYVFDNWYVNGVTSNPAFNGSATITADVNVIANWFEDINYATLVINPNPMVLLINGTGTITLNPTVSGDIVESYTCTSDNDNIASVSNCTITGVAAGNTFITISGSDPLNTKTVNVTVNTPIEYHTVTFYKELNGEVVKTVQVEHGTQIGSANMPSSNPTKTNYVFDNWYVNGVTSNPAFNGSATITANVDVIANWFETVDYATLSISPDPMTLNVGGTGTITLNPTVSGDTVESYSCTSDNDNIASVSGCTVTAVAPGNTFITISGSDPLNTKTVNVTVNAVIVYHTVKFYKELNGEVVKTVQVEHGTQIGSANMPSSNPTKTNYVFDNWYVNGVTSNPAFNGSATITANVDVIANWFETVDYATLVINPDPMVLNINETGTIVLNPTVSGDMVESYTCTSGDDSIASVNNCTITGVDEGTTTITITGSDPLNTKTVSVTVNPVTYTVKFDKNNGDSVITINDVAYGTALSTLVPANPTKASYTFDDWYLVDNGTWTIDPIDTTILVTENLEYKAGFYSANDVAAIGPYYYETLANTFNAIGTGAIPSTVDIRILKDFTVPTTSGQNRPAVTTDHEATIYGNGHTITCGNNNIIWVNGGTVTINNLTLTCGASKTAPIDNAGTINVIDSTLTMTLTGTNGRATIYNTGTVNIYGNSNLSTVAKDRPTVQNVSSGARINIYGGTITQAAADATEAAVKVVSGSYGTITGGTITSTYLYGVYNAGTLVIGTKDDQYSTTSIVITGEQYGINSTTNYALYDGLIKGKTNNQAVNDFNKINKTEDNSTRVTGTDGDYYTLYYTLPTPTPTATPTPSPTPTPTATPIPNQLTINFDAIGVTNPSSQQVYEGSEIGSLPTVTWGNKTFDGWYTDTSYTTQVTTSTIPEDDTTYYAKWTYTPANTKVTYDSTNDAMDEYFDNISSWKNQNESTFATTMLTNFNNNSCSNCNAANNCNNPSSGTYCDKPKEYNTNANAALSVFLYNETNHVIGEKVEYASLSNGKITNLIPGITYYWEKASDPSVNGLIEATTPRRVVDAGNVRNVRDLGGLSVTYTENNVVKTGTIKYGKLFRGAKLSSSQADVTSLANLGITREIDLRPDSERDGAARFTVFDNYGNGGSDIVIHNYLINRTAITYSYLDGNNNSQTTVAANTSYATELKNALKATMQYIIDGDSIYFHCTIGTDRTGTLAYFLEGLLGVSEEDRVEDYELTYFFGLTNRTRYHDHLDGSSVNPRFTFMHVTYPSNQDIYDWFVSGDTSSELTSDNALITAFRNAMIDN